MSGSESKPCHDGKGKMLWIWVKHVFPHTFDIAPNLPGQRWWCLRIYYWKSLRGCFKIELMSSSVVFKLLTCFQEHATALIQELEETQNESLEEWYLLVTWQSCYFIRLTGQCCSGRNNTERYFCCPLPCPNNIIIYSFLKSFWGPSSRPPMQTPMPRAPAEPLKDQAWRLQLPINL